MSEEKKRFTSSILDIEYISLLERKSNDDLYPAHVSLFISIDEAEEEEKKLR